MEMQTAAEWAQVRRAPKTGISNSAFLLDWMAGAEPSMFVASHVPPFNGSSAGQPSVEIERIARKRELRWIVPSHP
jgi:hypothetical protein